MKGEVTLEGSSVCVIRIRLEFYDLRFDLRDRIDFNRFPQILTL